MNKDELKEQLESSTDIVLKEENELKREINVDILDDSIYKNVLDNSRIKYQNAPNYLLFERDGEISIGHLTQCNNTRKIRKMGRLVASDCYGTLGKGIYVINREDIDSLNYLKSHLENSNEYGNKIAYVYGLFKGYYVKCEFSRNSKIEKGIYLFSDTCEQHINTILISKRNLIDLINIKIKVYKNEKISIIEKIKYFLWTKKTKLKNY